jgi:hypothetical protein
MPLPIRSPEKGEFVRANRCTDRACRFDDGFEFPLFFEDGAQGMNQARK